MDYEMIKIKLFEIQEMMSKIPEDCKGNTKGLITERIQLPKFKVGDWVVDNECGKLNQIDSVRDKGYDFANGDYMSHESAHEELRLWTIQDAKDGDVLVCDGKYGQEIGIVKKYIGKYGGCDMCFNTYCFVDWDGIFRVGEYIGSRNIHPATKEQCNLFFQKMKEAGYEFDFDKKELKKIEL